MTMLEYTHPDVLTRGVLEGWADPETDPTRINWAERQARAAIPFQVINGRPVNPCEKTQVQHGRNELGHWGEKQAADAIVTATYRGRRWLLMVERDDDHGWAVPGGCLDPGEEPGAAAVRELAEETGLRLDGADDARRAAWVRADTYAGLLTYLIERGADVFPAHRAMLADILG